MECSENILLGKAQALNIPIDSIKEFVEVFNAHVRNDLPAKEITADINDLEADGHVLKVKWDAESKHFEFAFGMQEKSFDLVIH